MPVQARNMLAPLTESAPGVPGEMTFTEDVAAPTATTDSNVYEIRAYSERVGGYEEVEETWQFFGRVSGTAAATAEIDVIIWCYNAVTAQFYPLAAITVVGVDGLSTIQGNAIEIPGVMGTTHVGFQVDGILADQDLHMVHVWR